MYPALNEKSDRGVQSILPENILVFVFAELDATSNFTFLTGGSHPEEMVERALEHARNEGYEVIPSCWYVKRWVERHPDYAGLLRG